MGHPRYGFSKKEKLTSKKTIEGLFKTGSSFRFKAFFIRHKILEEEGCHQILISVPKKNFKRAVDRNLIKRRIREAYRLNKELIYKEGRNKFLSIAFVYLSKNILTFHEIQDQLISALERLDNVVDGN
ncbi:MAG: ribonuclease P protein component [Bacteroidota bacterium]